MRKGNEHAIKENVELCVSERVRNQVKVTTYNHGTRPVIHKWWGEIPQNSWQKEELTNGDVKWGNWNSHLMTKKSTWNNMKVEVDLSDGKFENHNLFFYPLWHFPPCNFILLLDWLKLHANEKLFYIYILFVCLSHVRLVGRRFLLYF